MPAPTPASTATNPRTRISPRSSTGCDLHAEGKRCVSLNQGREPEPISAAAREPMSRRFPHGWVRFLKRCPKGDPEFSRIRATAAEHRCIALLDFLRVCRVLKN